MSTKAESKMQAALDAIKSGLPPLPSTARFKPLRMGVYGLWQYDEQEFYFHDGRLALLGRNGSGKTKVLEVTSPFLFDANLTARRLDPFGHTSRSMRDNLLYGQRNQQIGYVWCEYGRVTEAGPPEYVTIGAGLRAQASKAGAPDPWYFLTSQRVNVDFRIFEPRHRTPASRKELTEILEPGQVFDTAEDYRNAVGERLFGMSPARYRSLVELLLTMRRPKLSENFGVQRLTETLSEGLPPVDPEQINELAQGFDDLSRDREDLADLERVGREVKQFLRAYRIYARRTVRYYGAQLRSAASRYDNVTRRKREAEQQLEANETALSNLRERAAALDREITAQNARVRVLERGPELEQHAALLALDQQARKAEEQTGQAAARLLELETEYQLTEGEFQEAESRLGVAREQFDDDERIAAAHANACGLRGEHEVHSRRLLSDLEATKRLMAAVVEARRSAVQNAKGLLEKADKAQRELERAQETRDAFVAQKQGLARLVLEQQAQLNAEIEAVSTAIISWAGECRELVITGDTLGRLLQAVEHMGGLGASSPANLIRDYATAAESALLRTLADAESEIGRLQDEHTQVVAQRRTVAAEADPPPPEPLVTRRDRERDPIPGAPLWRVLEFASGVSVEIQAGIEAALLGAGMLDAWVTPAGTVIAPDTLEVLLLPVNRTKTGATLATVLRVAEQDRLEPEAVTAILDGIGYHEHSSDEDPGDWIGGDGGWSIGPLRGRTESRTASYIGAAAREAARRRHLQDIDRRLDELEGRLADLRTGRSVAEERIERLRSERDACPGSDLVLELNLRLDATLERASEVSTQAAEAGQRCVIRLEAVQAASAELELYGREHYLGTTAEALAALDDHLVHYREQLAEVFTQANEYVSSTAHAESVRSRFERVSARKETAAGERERAEEDAISLRAEYETHYDFIGADVEQVIVELAEVKAHLDELRRQRLEVEDETIAATEGLGSARSTLQAVEESRKEHDAERIRAGADFERLRAFGLLALCEVPGLQATTTGLRVSLEDARAAEQHLHEEESDERARNQARNSIDERFRSLQIGISGPDWNPWGANEGDLFIVKVTHNGEDHAVPKVNTIIENEIDHRRAYLDDQERQLFADVLIGRVGEHLRECRVRATKLYEAMNELLSKRRTASGRQMQLVWEPDPEAGPKVQRALEIFDAQSIKLLTEEARRELVDFLAERVRDTRDGDREGDWREHLREALDYRRWARFRIQIRDDVGDRWTNLNDSKHQQGSGGEKAVMLQLPLFVAAAAHYVGAAPTAPHPIYLDEAFAGIDAEMRGECMKLLVELDLDFVLASHDEWGFHQEVPGLVTYSLFRDPKISGVLATPFLWDGTKSSELTDPMLKEVPEALPERPERGLFDG
ncbi:TIGR02680 family protein [Promicromonospora sukumoe]